jgi:hypothetical protein
VTKPGRTAIAILADRSRATRPVRAALRAGLAGMLSDQQDRADQQDSANQQDTADQQSTDVLATVVPTGATMPALRPVADVTVPALRSRGTAAVRDDLGVLITDLGAALSTMPEEERPSRVLVLVVGAGTAGTRWSRDAIADLVGAQHRDYAWEFAFVGLGTDTAAAAELGIGHALTCTPSEEGVRAGLAAASAFLSRARDGQPWAPVEGFGDAERAAAAAPADETAATASWWQRLLGRKPEMATSEQA